VEKADKRIAMVGSVPAWRKAISQPRRFTVQVVKAFQKTQGPLLSGALVYYILLSVIPLLPSCSLCFRMWSMSWQLCGATLA
jgi:hypothetical protein